MDPMMLTKILVLFGVMFFFLFIRFPVFYAIACSAGVFAVIFPGTVPTEIIGQGFIQGVNNYNFVAIVFYFLLGEIMNSGGITDRILRFGKAIMGHFTGALSQINIVASVIFAGVSGSAAADTACIGATLIPMMKKEGYSASYSAAITGCSAIVGPIIPPSGALVLIGVFMGVSIRRLFIGGIVPGLIIGLFLLIASYIICKKRNYPKGKWQGWGVVWKEFKSSVWALMLPILVIFCLLAGIGTITEIGAVACFYAFILSIFIYRDLKFKDIAGIFMRAAVQIGRIMTIIASAGVFIWIISSMGIANWFAVQVTALGPSKLGLMFFSMFVIFIFGMILDVNVVQMVIIPMMLPTIFAFGIDKTVFGVLAIVTCMLGLNTPPVGQLIYMTASIADCNSAEVVKESIPFVLMTMVVICLLILFPQLVTFLPNLVG
ncbi:MAG: TRAP transporter large permease [Ruminiclostridium sp.]|nr:TRAP transporter large permease [Ruminiclostridium sp.]